MEVDRSLFPLLGRLRNRVPRPTEGTGQGGRRSNTLGAGVEFADHRAYHPGDDLRLVDWNAYARLETLLVRLFHEELLRVYPLHAVVYHCPRDEEKVADMLRSLGRAEVESILAEQGEVKIVNEMCNHEYRFDAAAVARMFEKIN